MFTCKKIIPSCLRSSQSPICVHIDKILQLFSSSSKSNLVIFFSRFRQPVLRATQPLTPVGREMSSSLRTTGLRPSVADWGGGMSVANRGTNYSLNG